jgi:hypothetical protein
LKNSQPAAKPKGFRRRYTLSFVGQKGQSVQRFEHYELVAGAGGNPVKVGRAAIWFIWESTRHELKRLVFL